MIALAIILMLLGLGFVLAEVFFPSLGLLGVMAGLCILGADVLAFEHGGQMLGWIFIALQVVLIPLVIRGAFRLLPRLGFGRRMLLEAPTDTGAGAPDLAHLVGREGETVTELRPSGTARIEGERVSVIAQGGVIPSGSRVRVVAIEGTAVRVRAVEAPAVNKE